MPQHPYSEVITAKYGRLGLRVGLGAVGEGRMRFLGRLSSGSGSSAAGRRAFRVVMGCVLGRAGGGGAAGRRWGCLRGCMVRRGARRPRGVVGCGARVGVRRPWGRPPVRGREAGARGGVIVGRGRGGERQGGEAGAEGSVGRGCTVGG
jgi:hypothetical protein